MKVVMNLNENYLHKVIRESINKVLNEAIDRNGLIKDVLFNGELYNPNNAGGYDIGIGYGCGTEKEFFSPHSERMEYSYCHVSVDEINQVVEELKERGYEFENSGEYVCMKGERRPFKPFIPMKPRGDKRSGAINPNSDPVGYYSDRLFKNSDGGNLHLF
jgi:hypothetical protein